MPQPQRQFGTVFHADSNYSCLRGTFIKSPSAVLGYPSERKMTGAKGRRFMKRELRRFRRNDGKRWVLDGMAVVQEEEAARQDEMRLLLLDDDLPDYDGDPNEYDYDEPCGCPSPAEHDYWVDRNDYYNGSNEDHYQAQQTQFDWGWEVHQEYLNGLEQGQSQSGYQCFLEGVCLGTRNNQHEHVLYGQSGSYIKAWNTAGNVVRDDRPWALTAS